MESDTRLYRIYIPQTSKIILVRKSDFKIAKGDPLPGFSSLIDGIARQVEQEEHEENITSSESHLIQSFLAMSVDRPPTSHLSRTKKRFDPNVPTSFAKACEYPGWCTAIDREYNSLVQRKTWRYVKYKPGMKPVPFTWVFKLKQLDAEGKKFLEKARCCLRGDRQQEYVDFDPNALYAPVASHESIRMLLACAAAEPETTIEGADIDNAYLYGSLDVPIIMQQPTNSSQKPAMEGYVCELVKSLYGTRQAGEIWDRVLTRPL